MARILIIEDSPTQAEHLRLLLEHNGFAVAKAPDGVEGLQCLRSAPFDLVMSDIVLPGISGYEVCRQIKSDPAHKNVPVVLLTALTDPMDVLQGLESGADNFITKPFDDAFLVQRIKNILANNAKRIELGPEAGPVLSLRGKGVTITADKEQVIELLLATLSDFIRTKNGEHEARLARETVERSRRLLQAALNALPAAMAILDAAGHIVSVNATWERSVVSSALFGPELSAGTDYLARCASASGIDPVLGQTLAAGIREVLDGHRQMFSAEYPCGAVSAPHWFKLNASRFEASGPVQVVLTHEEVTERKNLENELRQRAEQLAEKDKRKNQFMAMLAHELRNPLAPILHSIQILGRPDAAALAQQARDRLERQVQHLTRLVDSVLDVSRITQGKIQVRRERLDLADLVRHAAEDRRGLLEAAGMALTVDVPSTPVWVTGDSTRLTQVLNNLLDNAAKFRNGGDNVSVRLAEESNEVIITVQDNGSGIEAELFPRLFEPFAQADRSLDRARGGLGLGLSLVKGLTQLHGGDVKAESDGAERGAKFTIRLPVPQEKTVLTRKPTAPFPQVSRRRRILIVEDNRDAADSLRMLLEAYGHEVAAAYTGPEGVEMANALRPDIVLCDIGLPGLDGYGVANELRQNPETAKIPLIAITGYGGEDDQKRSFQAGFSNHLTKPVDPSVLHSLLETAS